MTQKEKVLGFVNENMHIPMSADEMALMLSVPKNEMDNFISVLDELEKDGDIIKTKKKRYASCKFFNMVKATLCGHERGFAFAEREDGEDIFISADNLNGALHGDVVLVKLLDNTKEDRRAEGEIVKILKESAEKIVGRLEINGETGFVVPVNRRFSKDIHVEKQYLNGAKNSDMVVAKIIRRSTDKKNPEGKILSVIGNINTPGVDILSVVESRNVPYEFSNEVIESAEKNAKDVTEDEIKARLDLTDELIITIDGDDAKDLDDAVNVKRLDNGNFKLGVHIADVGNYVLKGSVIDREAYERGTSIYLADRVIPMLPTVLSNGICSLNEGVLRLALSVIMEIDKNGGIVDYKIAESVICSKRRMTYTNVSKILAGDKEKREQFSELVPMIENMNELRKILKAKRMARGSIDFNFDEARIVLDENGKPIDVVKREKSLSTGIIEEFMLVANETVAEHFFWLNIPFVYRVHEEPDGDAIREFARFIQPFGYTIKHSHGKVHPKELAELIKEIEGKKEELIISSVALRSLMKARYSDENLGHFGLSSKYYCHFTSPIRRYPDLCIHRIIKDSLNGRLNQEKLLEFVKKASEQSSNCEVRAIELERDVEDMKKAEYMHERVGESFDAIITSVTSFGMFACLDNTIEGLIRLSDMEGFYVYDDFTKTLRCEDNGKIYAPGDRVKIIVARADAMSGKIDFVMPCKNANPENIRKKLIRKKHEAQRKKRNNKISTARYLKKKRKRR